MLFERITHILQTLHWQVECVAEQKQLQGDLFRHRYQIFVEGIKKSSTSLRDLEKVSCTLRLVELANGRHADRREVDVLPSEDFSEIDSAAEDDLRCGGGTGGGEDGERGSEYQVPVVGLRSGAPVARAPVVDFCRWLGRPVGR